MFKLGDRVKIVKKSEIHVGWVGDMNLAVGKTGTIVSRYGIKEGRLAAYKYDDDVPRCYTVKVDNNASENYWTYDEESLESVRKLKLKRVLNIK